MAIINKQFRQDIHKEVDGVMDRLEEQERQLNKTGQTLSPDQVYHGFSGIRQVASTWASYYRKKDEGG